MDGTDSNTTSNAPSRRSSISIILKHGEIERIKNMQQSWGWSMKDVITYLIRKGMDGRHEN